jgi:isoamylase
MTIDPDVPVTPGERDPLGATFDGYGTNFAVFSEVADAVELCLYAADGTESRILMPEVDGYVWHVYLAGVGPGTRYGYRVHGPWDPERGLWCNPAKLLADPYARMVEGAVVDHPALLAYDDARPGLPDARDSAPFTVRSLVVSTAFDWGSDRAPRTPLNETVIYEAHVKGLTARHPGVNPHARGTYLGVASPVMIEHYQRLGVSAVELLPVHHFVTEPEVTRRGLTNYWGYNTLGFFAPHRAYGAAANAEAVVGEFKEMVRELHAAGIEVLLDVVFNHTAEGGPDGPTYAFRGLDNPAYYRLDPEHPRGYIDTTGVGNSLNVRHPMALRLIMDSLRYWVSEMHVDGFRFDLASTLARELAAVDKLSAFFDLVAQDPVVNRVKLIAEPWDLGEGGYQVGNFPPLWTEWNGMYRDTLRDYWRGEPSMIDDLAARLAGSSDLYADDGRRPVASINFVTAHDGFTLADLVAYERKHNESNGEANLDGTDDNRSASYGLEGPTDDPGVLDTRARQQRNFLATLFLAQGVPMLLAGDERDRTQRGNNNAYCHDDALTWIDWADTPRSLDLEAFTAHVAHLRRDHAVFRRKRFLLGTVPTAPVPAPAAPAGPVLAGAEPTADDGDGPGGAGQLPDVVWLRTDGREMGSGDWGVAYARCLGMFLSGAGLPWLDRFGRPARDDSFLVLLNAWDQAVSFTLPDARYGARWQGVLDTTEPRGESAVALAAGDEVSLPGRSVLVLARRV